MAVLIVNVTDWVVIGLVGIGVLLVIGHLIRVYKKSPCGDCASAKQCSAFSKEKILKAYKKQCKMDRKKAEI